MRDDKKREREFIFSLSYEWIKSNLGSIEIKDQATMTFQSVSDRYRAYQELLLDPKNFNFKFIDTPIDSD